MNRHIIRFSISLFLAIPLFPSCTSYIEETRTPIPLIIDADTGNEIDDLYAIVRALVAPELNVIGITSAQYHNSPLAPLNSVRESQKLNEEIIELLDIKNMSLPLGSNYPLIDDKTPQESKAARFIIDQAKKMEDGEKLQIVILGSCTNVASAIMIDPSIIEKIEVSYIGFWYDEEIKSWSSQEFNSGNDLKAVDVLLNSPNLSFNSMTATTSGKLVYDKNIAQQNLERKGGIKEYLFNRWKNQNRWWQKDDINKLKWTMWDVAIIEALIHPENATKKILNGPKSKMINVYTSINVSAMKKSFWESIDNITNIKQGNYLIQNISIYTMLDSKMLENQDVYIENGKISSITNTGSVPITKDVEIINGNGKYLMPGLSEMHAHIPVIDDDGNEDHVKETMMLYLAHGITVIRGMLGNPYHLQLRRKVANGMITAPRIYTSSPSFNGNSVTTIEEAKKKVKDAKKLGYNFLKIHPGINLDVMKALVNTAIEEGINFSGHVPFDVGIENALQFGYSSVDHIDGYIRGLVPKDIQITSDDVGFFGNGLVDKVDTNLLKRLSQITKEKGVWVVPTQSLFTRWASPTPAAEMMQAEEFNYMSSKTRYTWRTNKDRLIGTDYSEDNYINFLNLRKSIIKSLFDHDVNFLLGSDSPQVMNVPGFSIHHEIASLQECGIPVYDIIKSGTVNPAIFFDSEDTYGTIQVGSDADFIIVELDPMESPGTMKKPFGTMIQGKWLDRDYFERELKKLAEKHSD